MIKSDLSQAIRDYSQEYASALQRQTSIEPSWAGDLAPFLIDLQRLKISGPVKACETRQDDHPALVHLEHAFKHAEGSGQDRLLTLARALSDRASWCLSYADEGWGAQVADRMVACQIIGPHGLWQSDNLAIGIFLLAPELYYPLHAHKAAEVYYVLGGGADFYYGSEDAEPLSRGPGQIAVTRSTSPHAIENGIEPSLVLYAWRGQISEPTWSLEPGPEGDMQRGFPAKRPIT